MKNVAWAAYAIWAPSAIRLNGKCYLFFAANDIQKTDTFAGGIDVAMSDKPGGSFLDAIGKPLIGNFQHAAQPIDPMVYQDDVICYFPICTLPSILNRSARVPVMGANGIGTISEPDRISRYDSPL